MNYINEYKKWINSDYFDRKTREELLNIEHDKKEIEDRFYKNLDFGTGGLRGIIGAGSNRINIYTIRRATLGLANYIIKNNKEQGTDRGVVIAYDSRYMSKEFCEEAAKTLAACGIKSYIFDSLKSTPQLSFAIRYLNCIAGIVITASHNPKEYNGYKVYWSDGGQICPNIAGEIIKEVNLIEDYSKIPTISYEESISLGFINILDEKCDNAFINSVKSQIIRQDIIDEYGSKIKIVYTPLHGTGNIPVRRVLKEVGFTNVTVVKEQEMPDFNFSTVKSPNPEEIEAFNIATEIARKENANIIIGTDPDCDRVGVIVKNKQNEYIALNGNQIGALLVNYIITNNINSINLFKNPTIIKTIVTSQLGAEIARSYGVNCLDTLTGFKFIGEKISEFEKTNNHTFIMGYEESYGYLIGTHARDKDGVVSSLLISEMATYYYSKGMSLYEGLLEIYEKHGYYKESLKSITLKGRDGLNKIKNIMSYFRECNIKEITDVKVKELKDYLNNIDGLPKSDVLKFILEDESWIAIRPSGTEPKIKFYIGCKGNTVEQAENIINNIERYIERAIKTI
ncbi:phospho-sugar mutase [Terrisporobacter sp.]|uniref:phospho-sugar mutase n=1 Tax=Terrisporobacter sp. TaxID=1965305 RepID=UPI0025E4843B|nr:phospho-sugar mutase [uncultured Terrisporobacter sp.]